MEVGLQMVFASYGSDHVSDEPRHDSRSASESAHAVSESAAGAKGGVARWPTPRLTCATLTGPRDTVDPR